MRHDWDDRFWIAANGSAAFAPRTSDATSCGPVPRLRLFGDVAMCCHLSPEGGLLFTGTASADAMKVCGMPTAAPHGDWPLRGDGWRQILRGQRPRRRPQTAAIRRDWDDGFGIVTISRAASTPRTSGATFCGAVPRLGSFGVGGDGLIALSPTGDLVFTGTASADAMKVSGMPTAAPHG
ncbi:MAG TPA: hypothetical protein VGK19_11920 [Capsulimonadaceae bacterium]|jgi:hypothetical protein